KQLIFLSTSGGQFEMAAGGHIGLANGGHIKPVAGGQFEWIFHFTPLYSPTAAKAKQAIC
ncbi:hypothetical protein, partial [Lacibacter luteus]|uniref:hypothetical protein n=1 Tax=Lacibacter luteus TaxID=2508719 RepID=UPI00197B3C53